jgi:hypothetical protein
MCESATEWKEFCTTFQFSTHTDEKQFYIYLRDSLVPLIIKDLEIVKIRQKERDEKDAIKFARKRELDELRRQREEQQWNREQELQQTPIKPVPENKGTMQLLRSGRQTRVVEDVDDFVEENDEPDEEYVEAARKSKSRRTS